MKALHQSIYAAVIAGLCLVFLVVVKTAPTGKKETKEKITAERPQATISVRKTPPESPTIGTGRERKPLPLKRLARFEELRGKVLLSQGESSEREALLSDRHLAQWIAYVLTTVTDVRDLKRRFAMIDFLEEALAWKDNPVREEVIRAITNIIMAGPVSFGTENTKRQIIGDKIELFAILSEQAPNEAADVVSRVQGTPLEPVLKYAAKRLPINPVQSEE